MSDPNAVSPTPPMEPTGSIEPVTLIDPAQVPAELMTALGRMTEPVMAQAVQSLGAPPPWTPETAQAIQRIGDILTERCPEWVWSPWNFKPSVEQVNEALIAAGYKSYDNAGRDVAHDPEGKGRAQIQTINWDAHYRGPMADPTKGRVVSDSRPENGGIDPIVVVGVMDAEIVGTAIANKLTSWTLQYGVPEIQYGVPESPSNGHASVDGSTPVSGVMAWACGLCGTVVRQNVDGTMPSFVCRGCGQTKGWRQPTMDELANVTPGERAAVEGSRGRPAQGPAVQAGIPAYMIPPDAGAAGANFMQSAQPMMPDPETRAIADICWLLEQLPVEARSRVVRYVRDRWS